MKELTLGIPNGSLSEPTIQLLKTIGITIKANGRKFMASIAGAQLFAQAIFMRPQDIPEAIIDGIVDVGICGWDCVAEADLTERLVKIAELNYSKQSRQSVRIVVFGKSEDLIDEEGILVTTEYPNLTKQIFSKSIVRFSHGGTEPKVAYGKYNYGVGVVETGASLQENGLKILKTILVSPTVVVAREDKSEIRLFGDMLSGALQAERYCLVKMNCAFDKLNEVLSAVPALRSPTISNLSDGSFAIESVVAKENLADILVRLKIEGASGILVQDLNILL